MTLSGFVTAGQGDLHWPGLEFDKEKHEYTYRGKKLCGVTGKISKHLGKNFETSFVEEHRGQGSHIHDAIEAYIRTGLEISVHPAARWVVEQLRGLNELGFTLYSEVLIMDWVKYASAIDILAIKNTGQIHIIDTKTGKFDRTSVSWQLGIYKYFLHAMTEWTVTQCLCLSTKDQDIYPIIPCEKADVRGLLYK